MEELTKKEQDFWDGKAMDFITHNPEHAAKPYVIALLQAILTIRARDKEIESLKK